MTLELSQITVRFGAVTALDAVSLTIAPATVHALLGGNGAGKSTLIAVASGVITPVRGELRVDGAAAHFNSPAAARAAGIATVFQNLSLLPLMSVWRNFVLGAEPTAGRGILRRLDVAAARAQATRALQAFAIDLDLDQPVATLSGGQRQVLAIARAVHAGARLLILDEPTAALAVDQADRVLDSIRTARDAGCGVLFVTHNPQHALAVADWITLLRRGTIVHSAPAPEWSGQQLHAAITS